jgi:DNA-binding PadR family transcriptional regulator
MMLGEFEFLVLAAIARLQPNAYGANVAEEVASASGRDCSSGALYVTLDRLENKQLIYSEQAPATEARAGRRRRMLMLTAEGAQAALDFQRAIARATRGVRFDRVRTC